MTWITSATLQGDWRVLVAGGIYLVLHLKLPMVANFEDFERKEWGREQFKRLTSRDIRRENIWVDLNAAAVKIGLWQIAQ